MNFLLAVVIISYLAFMQQIDEPDIHDVYLLLLKTSLFLIIGAFRYLTSSGNEEAAEAAKKMMTNAVVGLIIIIMSFAMIYIITRALLTGSPAA